MKLAALFLFAFLSTSSVFAWNNGLARTPPMGWMSWLKYACNIDCKNYPNECIDEKLYRDMLDRLAEDGYSALGYNTVNIDDCWNAMQRDPVTKRLVPDPIRFPSGIKSLASYAHSKGLYFGIYSDVGTKTCGGYPSTRTNGTDYTDLDAETFSDWQIDSLKLDGCNADESKYNETYPEFTMALAKQSHKMAYACSWPAYLDVTKMTAKTYEEIQANCNYWRNFDDIMDSWKSVSSIIDFYRKYITTFAKYHGPGGWFDADMLIIGNDGLSLEQSKAQMAFWSLWSVPLLMSNDLRTIRHEFKAVLQNKHLIAVNQDPLGIMGHVVTSQNHLDTWVKKLAPLSSGLNPWAVLYFNNNVIGVPSIMSHRLSDLIPELKPNVTYAVHDLYDDYHKIATLTAADKLTLKVPTSGAVRIVKLVPIDSQNE